MHVIPRAKCTVQRVHLYVPKGNPNESHQERATKLSEIQKRPEARPNVPRCPKLRSLLSAHSTQAQISSHEESPEIRLSTPWVAGFATSGFTSSSLKAACQAENVQLGSRIRKKNLWKTHQSLKLIEFDIDNTIKYINTLSALVPLGDPNLTSSGLHWCCSFQLLRSNPICWGWTICGFFQLQVLSLAPVMAGAGQLSWNVAFHGDMN